jgi:hypothetical protein
MIEVYRRELPLNQEKKSELIFTPSQPSVSQVSITRDDNQLFIEQSFSNLDSKIIMKDLKKNIVVDIVRGFTNN